MNYRQIPKGTGNPSSDVSIRFIKVLVLACTLQLAHIRVAAQEPNLQVHRTVLESGNVPGSYFGAAVAASGDTVVVASYSKGVGVYVKPPGGWKNATAPTAVLTASDTNDGMGAVAIDGDVIVAAPMYTNEAYVFVKPTAGWVNATETARLSTTGNLNWNHSAAISGNTIALGFPASYFDAGQGAVGIFVEPEGGWTNMTPTAILTSSDGASDDNLGWTVAVAGNTVVGGAPRAAINSQSWAGALYVFNKPAGGWQSMTQTAKLTASTVVQGDEIGLCLGMQGNLIAAGAQITQYAAIFQKLPGGWSNMTATAQLNSPPNAYSFGTSVAVISDVIAVGAPFAPIFANLGQIYLFKEPKSGWQTTSVPTGAIKAGTAGGEQDLGFSVGGSTSSGLVAGAVGYNDDAGAAYVFSLQ